MTADLSRLLSGLRAGGFRELAGSTLALRLVVAEPLLNRVLAERLPGTALGELRVRPIEGGGAIAHLKLARPAFLPAIGLTLQIERQPSFPGDGVLVLRWSSLPGLTAVASFAANLMHALPPAVKMIGDRIYVDIARLLAERIPADVLPLIERMEVTTRPGAVVLTLDLSVRH